MPAVDHPSGGRRARTQAHVFRHSAPVRAAEAGGRQGQRRHGGRARPVHHGLYREKPRRQDFFTAIMAIAIAYGDGARRPGARPNERSPVEATDGSCDTTVAKRSGMGGWCRPALAPWPHDVHGEQRDHVAAVGRSVITGGDRAATTRVGIGRERDHRLRHEIGRGGRHGDDRGLAGASRLLRRNLAAGPARSRHCAGRMADENLAVPRRLDAAGMAREALHAHRVLEFAQPLRRGRLGEVRSLRGLQRRAVHKDA